VIDFGWNDMVPWVAARVHGSECVACQRLSPARASGDATGRASPAANATPRPRCRRTPNRAGPSARAALRRSGAPAEIYACLLDQGLYHCSIRTMYRILAGSQEVRERRKQLRHPIYKKPELLAQAPNEVWSCRRANKTQFCAFRFLANCSTAF
jgi:hypothetical protein